MLNILILTKKGEGYGIAERLSSERNIVKFWTEEVKNCKSKSSTVQIINNWGPHLEAADLVILTSSELGGILYQLAKGRRVFGCGMVGNVLESDPSFKVRVMKLLKVDEHIKEGVNVTIGGWFNGTRFILPYIAFHIERFMEGERGKIVEGMGCVSKFLECSLGKRILNPLEELLKSLSFYGALEVDCIMNENSVNIKNITTKFRNGCFQSLLEGVKEPLGELLVTLPTKDRSPEVGSDWNISVGLSIPPWPFSTNGNFSFTLEVPIPARRHVWIENVNGFLSYVTARGQDIREARRRVYRTVDNLITSKDIQYRRDVGFDVEEKFKSLEKWGWINANDSNAS